MATLPELVRTYAPGLVDADVDHLHVLVAEWQMLADLSFADLLLFVRRGGQARGGTAPPNGLSPGQGWVCVAHVRPATGSTLYQDDQVGRVVAEGERYALDRAWREGRIVRDGEPVWRGGTPVREEGLPVRHHDRVVAVISRDTDLATSRVPSRLELAYLEAAGDLARMVADGRFPFHGVSPDLTTAPRVGDGLLRLDDEGVCTFASPNALSAYRRLGLTGNLVGLALSQVHRSLTLGPGTLDHARVDRVLDTRRPAYVEVQGAGSVLLLHALPLLARGRIVGALVLVRDLTEVRSRDRALMSKDATIREIHHRVKNNLQTVAALLRLQARRVEAPGAREALAESVRRVTSIALVHETLSQTLDETVAFDSIADHLLASTIDVGMAGNHPVTARTGSFGILAARVATPLALVLSELVQNAVEHAFGGGPGGASRTQEADPQRGRLDLRVTRDGPLGLEVVVADSGPGLPADFQLETGTRLGLQIVRSLVVGELGGTFALRPGAQGGTEAVVGVPAQMVGETDAGATAGTGWRPA